MPSLRLVNVTKRFGRIEALDDVSFNVSDGEYLCVLGPTGSGKTTLLRLLAGLLEPDEGIIYFDEKPFNDVPAEERNVAYVPQTYALFPHMTVLENVMFGPLARGFQYNEAYGMAMEALRMVRLDQRASALPHELSGGMQQRVALARALASGARLLLLDEPLGALDARLRIELRKGLRNLAKASGSTVVHVTHDQEEAMTIADRILVLRNGRVQQHGTPFHIYRRPENIFVANFLGSSNFFEGIVVQRNRKGSLVRLRGNLELRVSDTSHMPGEAVIIALREERVRLRRDSGFEREDEGEAKDEDEGKDKDKDEDEDEGKGKGKGKGEEKAALLGDILAVQFLGSSIRYEIRLENGDRMAARIPTGMVGPSFKPGDRVFIAFDPEDALVYGYPALGLLQELEAY